jgi:hypothetical protein
MDFSAEERSSFFSSSVREKFISMLPRVVDDLFRRRSPFRSESPLTSRFQEASPRRRERISDV